MLNRLNGIRAVTFDVGGTLIEPWPSVGHVYAEVAARHGLKDISPDRLNRQFASAWKKLKHFHHRREEWAALVDETFAGLTPEPASGTFFDELYDRFREPSAWRVFDDVLPVLNALASRELQLGIISNWDERLSPLLKSLGLAKYFEAIVVSCNVGFVKPSPVIFEHAVRKLGLPPEAILHVGDSPDADMTGAKAAGFQAILLDRKSDRSGDGQVMTLRHLEDLI